MREPLGELIEKTPRPTDAASQALGEMPYGLYVIGSIGDGEPNGMMADWVMQVSFSPRLIAVAIENDARTLANIKASQAFTVNLLAADEMTLAAKFAQPYYGSKIKGRAGAAATEIHHKLEEASYRLGTTGCPILSNTLAWLECTLETIVPVGGHTLVVGLVLDGAVVRDAEPLTTLVTGWPYSG